MRFRETYSKIKRYIHEKYAEARHDWAVWREDTWSDYFGDLFSGSQETNRRINARREARQRAQAQGAVFLHKAETSRNTAMRLGSDLVWRRKIREGHALIKKVNDWMDAIIESVEKTEREQRRKARLTPAQIRLEERVVRFANDAPPRIVSLSLFTMSGAEVTSGLFTITPPTPANDRGFSGNQPEPAP